MTEVQLIALMAAILKAGYYAAPEWHESGFSNQDAVWVARDLLATAKVYPTEERQEPERREGVQ